MQFYYSSEMATLNVACPPTHYATTKLICYRWVFNEIEDERNFKARAILHPPILNNKSDVEKCACYALSFHDKAKNSQDHFDFLVRRYCSNDPSLGKLRFGSHIAEGVLHPEDGLSSEIEPNGHFNFHPILDHQFISNFIILRPL
jgi:hypothetical protein